MSAKRTFVVLSKVIWCGDKDVTTDHQVLNDPEIAQKWTALWDEQNESVAVLEASCEELEFVGNRDEFSLVYYHWQPLRFYGVEEIIEIYQHKVSKQFVIAERDYEIVFC